MDDANDNDWRDWNTYHVGESAPPKLPSERNFRYMLHIVAYDITEPKRLRRIAKTCEDYGVRIEKSVFECDLSDDDFAAFWHELLGLIDDSEDSIIAYRICKACAREIEGAGVIDRPAKRLYYIF